MEPFIIYLSKIPILVTPQDDGGFMISARFRNNGSIYPTKVTKDDICTDIIEWVTADNIDAHLLKLIGLLIEDYYFRGE